MAAAKKKASKSKAGGVRKPARAPDVLTQQLAEASWIDADQALAEALALFDELEDAPADPELLQVLGQALTRAARRRGLQRLGAVGEELAYSAAQHELLAGRSAKTVVIVARGVAQGHAVLVRPRVRKAP